MTPRIVCRCGQWWYEGQTPLCQHMDTEVSHEAERPASQRGQEAYSELFAASDVILDWLKELHPRDRPIAKFNRLNDAIDRVREAHQMHGFDWTSPAGDRS